MMFYEDFSFEFILKYKIILNVSNIFLKMYITINLLFIPCTN